MILIIECIILCIIFTIAILIPLYKNPLSKIIDYPTAIRKKVEKLPEYKNIVGAIKQKHIFIKIIGVFLIALVLAVISYLTGNKTFFQVFLNTFILFFVLNLYDLLVLDIIIFCHSKKLIIKGTEDMIKEYKNPKHHIIGFFIGIGIGLFVSLLSGGIISLYNIIKIL
jgi:hypothetical protein